MKLYLYQGLVALDAAPNGQGKRVSVEASSEAEATELLEAEYGAGKVVCVWGGWEAEQILRDK